MKKYLLSTLCITAASLLAFSGCSPAIKSENSLAYTQSVQAFNNTEQTEITNDPNYREQWGIFSTNTDRAWSILNSSMEIKVAIVDTGVDYNHPDLKNRVLRELGYNFINNSRDVMDDNWHGTHVAGIIAAEADNNIGITGIVGKANVKIIPIKALDSNGQGSSDIIAKGIKYAADTGADIINFSVGFDVKDAYIGEAIKYAKSKGVLVIVSSGNNGRNSDYTSPAGDEGAYTISSVNIDNQVSVFSNFGSSVKLAAPGEEILSTVPGGGYEYRDGTSMAAPLVAGVAAMVKAQNPMLTADEIENILSSSAVDIMENGSDIYTGYGIIDSYRALDLAETNKRKI
jgi:subtilisin family serine protease